jgi:hypothetical protein
MTNDTLNKDEQLLAGLVSSFASSAWIAMGKIKNPMSDRIERNLGQASYAIDMLDMIQRRMSEKLNEAEKTFLQSTLGDLKLNFVEEQKKPDPEPEEETSEETENEPEESDEPVDDSSEEETQEK